VVQVTGEGTLNFLNSKLTNSFTTIANNSDGRGDDDDDDDDDDAGKKRVIRVERGVVTVACLLESRGRMIDRILALTFATNINNVNGVEANIITSPGHAGSALFERLDPFIFPLDGVKLVDMFPTTKTKTKGSSHTKIFTVGGKTLQDAQLAVRTHVLPFLTKEMGMKVDIGIGDGGTAESSFSFPQDEGECVRYTSRSKSILDDTIIYEEAQVTILEHTFLPGCLCQGYTFLVSTTITTPNTSSTTNADDIPENKYQNPRVTQPPPTLHTNTADRIWSTLVSQNNLDGPVELGSLEYETLRIEGGQPGFGYEISCDEKQKKRPPQRGLPPKEGQMTSPDDDNDNGIANTNASPYELHLGSLVDKTKGCYVGQEGIASLLKNKLGVPRILYSVIFRDDDNPYNDMDNDDDDDDDDDYTHNSPKRDDEEEPLFSNKTFRPTIGDELFVLGSNEQIRVGTLTSVAEPGGTSTAETVALALVKRETSILKKMKGMDLEIGYGLDGGGDDDFLFDDDDDGGSSLGGSSMGSGLIQPPPIDPLDGLEVVIGGSFTQGILRVVASRRLRDGLNLFDTMGFIPQGTGLDADAIDRGAAVAENGIVEVEGQDKVNERDALLKDVNINDKAAVTGNDDDNNNGSDSLEDLQEQVKAATQAAAEAQRKAEKLAALQQRTEEAIAARKRKKEEIQAQKEKEAAALASVEGDKDDPDRKEAELKRKAEKMEMLRKKMEAGMEARRQKKSGG